MMPFEFISQSREQTLSFARQMAARAVSGDVFCLTGALGAGKTVFANGFGQGLGVRTAITSPTFTLLHVYEEAGQRLPFYHIDAWRLGGSDEMFDTGLEDYIYGNGVCLIEWADLVRDITPPVAIWVDIQKDAAQSDDYRKIICKGGMYDDFSH